MSESVGRGVGASVSAEYSIWRVILASAVGTMIEWYDFYIFGSLAAVLSPKFYPPGQRDVCLYRVSGDVCGGIFGAAIWRVVFRADRRRCRAQICVSGDAFDHGRGDGGDWVAAIVQDGGMVCADHADADSRAARIGARRRVWRCDGVRRGACARRQARVLHELHSNHGDAGAVRVAAGDFGDAELDEQRGIRGLGMADSILDFHRAGIGFVVHPAEDERVADLSRRSRARA